MRLSKLKTASIRALPAVIIAFALILAPGLRNSAKELCNALFRYSERTNTYVYEMYNVPENTSPVPAAALICAGIMSALYALGGAAPPVFAAALAFCEVYFGVTPAGWVNLALFLLPAFFIVKRLSGIKAAALCALSGAAIYFAVSLFFPGTDANLEQTSETVRDRLYTASVSVSGSATDYDSSQEGARHGSLLNKNSSVYDDEEKSGYLGYEVVTETEREISRPQRINYIKIALMLLGVAAVIVIPFAPFAFLESRRRKAAALRSDFDSQDASLAARSMFTHMETCAEESGVLVGNRLFSRCAGDISDCLSPEYAELYNEAVEIWQRAEYDPRPLEPERAARMGEITSSLEDALYAKADRKTRFRLKYIDCLYWR